MPNSMLPPVTPLEGKTTIDDVMVFGPVRLSYRSAIDIAEKIAAQVTDRTKGRVVVIAGTSLLADFANLQAIYLLLEGLRTDYHSLAQYAEDWSQRRAQPQSEEADLSFAFPTSTTASLLTGAAAVALTPVSTFLGAALGLVSLFRKDVEYHGAQTVVDPLAFELALAAKLRERDPETQKVFVSDLMVVPLAETQKDSLRDRLQKVQTAKARAWAAIGPSISQLVRLEAQLDQATKDKNKDLVDRLSGEVSNLRRDLDPLVAPLERADQQLADLQTQWNQIDQSTGLTGLARLLRAEAVHALHPIYLHAAIVSSGGYNRISRSLFSTIFRGDGVSFAGGAIARWALLKGDGSVDTGGILTAQRSSGSRWALGDSAQD
jgi:hypothetical protein